MFSERKSNPVLEQKIKQMKLPLAPLVRLTTGQVHPAFPNTLLNFWLLTSDQLDELAHFYHQRTPSVFSSQYPCPVVWEKGLTIEDKRRKIGRFIGLRGCESPVRTEEEILERMRRAENPERHRSGEEEKDIWRRKLGWYQ